MLWFVLEDKLCLYYTHTTRCLQEVFLKKCSKKVQSIQEQDLWIDGEFLSESDMVELGYKQLFGCSMLQLICMHGCRIHSGSSGSIQHHILFFLVLQVLSGLLWLRTRIDAVKAECQNNKGWVRYHGSTHEKLTPPRT